MHKESNLLIFWLKGNAMTHLMSLEEWVESQACGPLPHFWPSAAVTTFYERRVHGRTLPRANRAEAGTVADYWLTQIGVDLIEYLMAREEAPTTLLLRRAEYPPGTAWLEFAKQNKEFFTAPIMQALFPKSSTRIEACAARVYDDYRMNLHSARVLRTWSIIMSCLDPEDFEHFLVPEPEGALHPGLPTGKEIRSTMKRTMSSEDHKSILSAQEYEEIHAPETVTPESSQAQQSLSGHPWPGGTTTQQQKIQQSVLGIRHCMQAPVDESPLRTMIKAHMTQQKDRDWIWGKDSPRVRLGDRHGAPSASASSSRFDFQSESEESESDHEYARIPYYVRAPHLPAQRLRRR